MIRCAIVGLGRWGRSLVEAAQRGGRLKVTHAVEPDAEAARAFCAGHVGGKPAEFRVHMQGALANGCTPAQVQDLLLLVAMYCGIPAAIEPNRIAAEIFDEAPPSG
jgi:alkylhydroperoxidase/carboxymuconolactone decarboxylase family protein YurZ